MKGILGTIEESLNQSAPMAKAEFITVNCGTFSISSAQFLAPESVEEWNLKAARGEDEFVINATHLKILYHLAKKFLNLFVVVFKDVRDT